MSGESSGEPSVVPGMNPTFVPSGEPICAPSGEPNVFPVGEPSHEPSGEPSGEPSVLGKRAATTTFYQHGPQKLVKLPFESWCYKNLFLVERATLLAPSQHGYSMSNRLRNKGAHERARHNSVWTYTEPTLKL